jgi:hypothetical protein
VTVEKPPVQLMATPEASPEPISVTVPLMEASPGDSRVNR